jgi:hypothetical protein
MKTNIFRPESAQIALSITLEFDLNFDFNFYKQSLDENYKNYKQSEKVKENHVATVESRQRPFKAMLFIEEQN